MGCDIHIVIQRQDDAGVWQKVTWQPEPWHESQKIIPGVPVAPDCFDSRNYNKFAILADVRNGHGFAGIKTGEGWPSIAPHRGLPEGFTIADGDYSLGDHSYTWVLLDELKAFPWDATKTTLYGVVPADEYEKLTVQREAPTSYSGGISGPGIVVYEPDAYRLAKTNSTLAERPHVRMGWEATARKASYDWPGKVLPWLDSLADGRQLRLVLGFDS